MKLVTRNIPRLEKVHIEQLVHDNIEHLTSENQINEFIEQVSPFSKIGLTYDYTLKTVKAIDESIKDCEKLRLLEDAGKQDLEDAGRKDMVQRLQNCQRNCLFALTQLEDNGIPNITDQIIMKKLGCWSINQVTPRFSELIRLGLVVTGDKVESPVTGAYVRTLKTVRKEKQKYHGHVLQHKPLITLIQEAA